MAEVVALPARVPSLGRAVERFLAAKPLSPNALRSYAYCLGAVVSNLGADTALAAVTPERLRGVLENGRVNPGWDAAGELRSVSRCRVSAV